MGTLDGLYVGEFPLSLLSIILKYPVPIFKNNIIVGCQLRANNRNRTDISLDRNCFSFKLCWHKVARISPAKRVDLNASLQRWNLYVSQNINLISWLAIQHLLKTY